MMLPKEPTAYWETCGIQVKEICNIMQLKAPTAYPERSGQEGDNLETNARSCGPRQQKRTGKHTPRNSSLETQAKSRGPDMQLFQRSWNPIKVGQTTWVDSQN
jgi:hypothetical protein